MKSQLINHQMSYTQSQIKLAFIRLYEEKGLEKITVCQICELSGISRPVFYKYFNDKYNILEIIETDILQDIRNLNLNMPVIPVRSNESTFPKFFETAKYVFDNRDFIRPLIGKPGDPLFIHKWNKLISSDIIRRFEHDHMLPDRRNIIAYSMASATIGLFAYWLQYEQEILPKEIATTASHLIWGAFYKFAET